MKNRALMCTYLSDYFLNNFLPNGFPNKQKGKLDLFAQNAVLGNL